MTARTSSPSAPAMLANWRLSPHSAWAFHHVRELIPTAEIAAKPSGALASRPIDLDLSQLTFAGGDGRDWRFSDLIDATHTDALVVLHRGAVAMEIYRGAYDGTRPHILFSVSKSLTGTLAGLLVADGLLTPDDPVVKYVPEIAGSAYGDCTVRHVLDMTVSTTLEEAYLDPDSDYARYRRATGWNPVTDPSKETDLHGFLAEVPRGPEAHGTLFRYRSPNSDLLGWILERAAGQRFADLFCERIWKPLGCESAADITVDRSGGARTAGGISTTARDLARFGELMRLGGTYDGRRIVPSAWIDDILTAGNRDAWQKSEFGALMPNGCYRSQWYRTGKPSGAFCGIGIHGQWLYVDPRAETVIVKFSSQPEPLDEALDHAVMAGLDALARGIAATG